MAGRNRPRIPTAQGTQQLGTQPMGAQPMSARPRIPQGVQNATQGIQNTLNMQNSQPVQTTNAGLLSIPTKFLTRLIKGGLSNLVESGGGAVKGRAVNQVNALAKSTSDAVALEKRLGDSAKTKALDNQFGKVGQLDTPVNQEAGRALENVIANSDREVVMNNAYGILKKYDTDAEKVARIGTEIEGKLSGRVSQRAVKAAKRDLLETRGSAEYVSTVLGDSSKTVPEAWGSLNKSVEHVIRSGDKAKIQKSIDELTSLQFGDANIPMSAARGYERTADFIKPAHLEEWRSYNIQKLNHHLDPSKTSLPIPKQSAWGEHRADATLRKALEVEIPGYKNLDKADKKVARMESSAVQDLRTRKMEDFDEARQILNPGTESPGDDIYKLERAGEYYAELYKGIKADRALLRSGAAPRVKPAKKLTILEKAKEINGMTQQGRELFFARAKAGMGDTVQRQEINDKIWNEQVAIAKKNGDIEPTFKEALTAHFRGPGNPNSGAQATFTQMRKASDKITSRLDAEAAAGDLPMSKKARKIAKESGENEASSQEQKRFMRSVDSRYN